MTAIGIYGGVAHSTNQRARELAIRATVGASPSDVTKLILSEGRIVALSGVALGLGAAYVEGQAVSSGLYGVNPEDPLVLGTAAFTLLALTHMAFLIPALRARNTSPAASLKAE
jgi:ABC-type antimicrobial peptide transport system permease subunit